MNQRRILRSYVLRQGRLTKGQQRGFDSCWAQFGLPYQTQLLNLSAVFGNHRPVYLEIGCGNGEALVAMAQQHPERNYIGVEVHSPGVGHLLLKLAEHGLTNVRICQHDAVEVLKAMMPDAALAGVYLFFPDPWHKKRHHKRRIVQPVFIELLARKIHADGFFHAATDWEDYAEHMLVVLNGYPELFRNAVVGGGYVPRPAERPLTKFEQRGRRLGHRIFDLIFMRC
jgi:tRNA (guanine-N7-)-methyltransferase